jgi:tetratricopeptide (TPR) repeat protein
VSRSRSFAASAALGAALGAIAFGAGGGTEIGRSVAFELATLAIAGAILAIHAVRRPTQPAFGAPAVAAFAAFTAVTALSLAWTITPDETLKEVGRSFTYLAVFTAAVAAARLWPRVAPAVAGGVLIAGTAVAAWALLTRVFPGELAENVLGARLGEPFGYWNALGGMVALTVPAALWVGARREGSRAAAVLAYPAMGLLLLTMLLTQSRGALGAGILVTLIWFAVVPLRLESLPVIVLPSLAVAPIAAWALSRDAFTAALEPLEAREAVAGDFGLMLVALVAGLSLGGALVTLARARRPLSITVRHRAGLAVAALVVGVTLTGLGTVAASDRGLGGTVSDRVDELTSEDEGPPQGAGRLGSVSSSRRQYWRQARDVFEERPLVGRGADSFGIARLKYRSDSRTANHAHGFVAQTLADLGLAGAAAALGLLVLWLAAALRSTGFIPRSGPRPEWTGERTALVAVALCAVAFGAQSTLDWTWFVPGPALTALVAAGFVAGRGPLDPAGAAPRPAPRPERRGPSRNRLLPAAAVVVTVALAALVAWQPERAARANDRVLESLEQGDLDAAAQDAKRAREISPNSAQPLYLTATVLSEQGRLTDAYRMLERAVIEHPRDPETWLRLATFELDRLDLPERALSTLEGARRADRRSQRVEALAARAQEVLIASTAP